MRRTLVFLTALSIAGGCGPSRPQGERVTDVDAALATPDYWWEKPAVARVELSDFDRAVTAVLGTMRARFLTVDRADLRQGVITSKPLISSQWFEPWRYDTVTARDTARSSLGTYRRTVRFDITRTSQGRYAVVPRVLVERESVAGRRISGVLGFGTFTATDSSSLVARNDLTGETADPSYWYATARDYPLESSLVASVVSRAY